MAITQNHIINIQPGVSAPLVIHCSQGDTGTQINLTVVNGDEEFDCSSYACSVHGTRSDRANWGPFTCNVSGSTVSFSLTSDMTAVAGSCLAEVSIGTVGTANFALLVENATFENGVTYSNDVSVYQNILTAVQNGLTTEKSERVTAVTNEKNERIAAVNAEAAARQTVDNTLQGNINSEASTRASTDTLLSTRIDRIIAPSGEAPSAAEVTDARIGADGVTYASLGTSVRTQIDDVKTSIALLSNATTLSLSKDLSTLITTSNLEQGGLNGNGLESDSSTRIRTKEYIKVFKDDVINISSSNEFLVYIHYYNDKFEHIGNSNGWLPLNQYSTLGIAPFFGLSVKFDESCYIRLVMRNSTSSDIVPSDFTPTIKKISGLSLQRIYDEMVFNGNVNSAISKMNFLFRINDFNSKRYRCIFKTFGKRRFKFSNLPSGYQIAFTDAESFQTVLIGGNYISDSGWIDNLSGVYYQNSEIPRYVAVSFKQTNEEVFTSEKIALLEATLLDITNCEKTYPYYGEKILFGEHKFKADIAFNLSKLSPNGVQGCDVYGNYLFTASGNSVQVYNRNNGQFINTFDFVASENNHSNTLIFADKLHQGNSKFPYAYFSEYYGNGRIFVNDIQESNNEFESTLVQTIRIDELNTAIVGAGYSDFAIDFANNILFLIRYKLANTYQAEDGNYQVITAFNLPAVNGDVSLQDSDILYTYSLTEKVFARQRTFFVDGKIYILAGAGNAGYLYIIDNKAQRICTKVYLSDLLRRQEPESCIFDYDKLLVVCNWETKVYSLYFE